MAKARKPNFTEKEKLLLLSELEKRQDVLRPKFSSKITSQAKHNAWREIADVSLPYGAINTFISARMAQLLSVGNSMACLMRSFMNKTPVLSNLQREYSSPSVNSVKGLHLSRNIRSLRRILSLKFRSCAARKKAAMTPERPA